LVADQAGTSKDDQAFWQNAPDIEEASADSDQFGFSLAAGDFNGDGQDDLAIGVPNEDVVNDSIDQAGLVNVIYGSSIGLVADQAGTIEDDLIFWQNAPGVEDVSSLDDSFGRTLITGDYNNDGWADLVIGVPFEDIGNSPEPLDSGLVNVIYGDSIGLRADHAGTSKDDQAWWQEKGSVDGASEPFDHFGFSLG
jgi:hypothetical protein